MFASVLVLVPTIPAASSRASARAKVPSKRALESLPTPVSTSKRQRQRRVGDGGAQDGFSSSLPSYETRQTQPLFIQDDEDEDGARSKDK